MASQPMEMPEQGEDTKHGRYLTFAAGGEVYGTGTGKTGGEVMLLWDAEKLF